MEEEAKLGCGCVLGEICCQEASLVIRGIREAFQPAMISGDWGEFDRFRDWLTEHQFGREMIRDTGEFMVVKRATRA